jgi:uncharacterized membrane protein YbhN (UPF0104 family)
VRRSPQIPPAARSRSGDLANAAVNATGPASENHPFDDARETGSLRRVASGALRVGFALALFAAVVFAVEQFVPGAGHRLARAKPAWLAVSVALEALALASYALLFHAVFARAPHRLRMRRSAQIALGELGAFAILPTGMGGPVLRFWALRASGMPLRTAVVRSLSHGGVFNAPYVLAALILGVGVSLRLLPGRAPVLTALAPVGVVLLACAIVWGASALSRADFMRHDGVWRTRTRVALATVPDGVRDLAVIIRRPGALVGALGWWVGDCAALWAAFHACGGAPALTVLVLAYMLGQLGTAFVPLPGGIGGVEPLMLGILVASGVNIGLAAAAIICYRAISLGAQGAAGALAFTTLTADLGHSKRQRAPVASPAGGRR